jgi:natural product biosynthesis luciferase-like monooxygenase protein
MESDDNAQARARLERAAEPAARTVDMAALQARFVEAIEQAIGHRVDEQTIVPHLGITSIAAVEIMYAIEEEFGLTIAAEHLTDSITIAELARRVAGGSRPEPATKQHSPAVAAPAHTSSSAQALDISLMYFSTDTMATDARFEVLLEGAKFADSHGFHAVWIPERHFHPFGGVFPNPSVAAAALAAVTRQIRLRAGSVVLPLHNPIRVAEEWSWVDNISNGRVDLSFAIGWSPNDYVLAPAAFEKRRAITLAGIKQIQQLWAGEPLVLPNGKGQPTSVSIHPRPVQPKLKTWFTCTSNIGGFEEAGSLGYNVLTALLFQRVDELAVKIEAYRKARERHGHDPDAGSVTLMLHTFVGPSEEYVRGKVSAPFKRYLASSVDLWKDEWKDLAKADQVANERTLDIALERYARGNALFGTPASCAEYASRLRSIGVDEIACLIDFGVATRDVLDALVYLDDMRSLLGRRQQVVEEARVSAEG